MRAHKKFVAGRSAQVHGPPSTEEKEDLRCRQFSWTSTILCTVRGQSYGPVPNYYHFFRPDKSVIKVWHPVFFFPRGA